MRRLVTPYCRIALAMALVAGCGDPRGRLPVSGSVAIGGKPLPQGNIDFLPADGKGTQSTARLGPDGRFELSGDRGLTPGSYLVRITSVVGTKFNENGFVTDPGKTLVGPEYNEKSNLTVEVKAGEKSVFEFDLK